MRQYLAKYSAKTWTKVKSSSILYHSSYAGLV